MNELLIADAKKRYWNSVRDRAFEPRTSDKYLQNEAITNDDCSFN